MLSEEAIKSIFKETMHVFCDTKIVIVSESNFLSVVGFLILSYADFSQHHIGIKYGEKIGVNLDLKELMNINGMLVT